MIFLSESLVSKFLQVELKSTDLLSLLDLQVTQLGHVKDLADAFRICLGNSKAYQQVFNISGERFVTFDGIAKACAEAAGAPEPELVHFNPKSVEIPKGKKAFPMRDQHFFASVDKVGLHWPYTYRKAFLGRLCTIFDPQKSMHSIDKQKP